jgi:hypothetical protein
VPNALFARPRPKDLITVPACDDCHTDEDSLDAECFAFQTAIHNDASSSPSAQAIYQTLIKGVGNPKKQSWANSVFRSLSFGQVHSPAGLYLGDAPIYELDVPRLQRVASRIIRGLYYHHWREPVPESYEVVAYSAELVRRLPKETRDGLAPLLAFVDGEPARSVGDVLRYRLRTFPEGAGCIALLVFYGAVSYLGFVSDREGRGDSTESGEGRVVDA